MRRKVATEERAEVSKLGCLFPTFKKVVTRYHFFVPKKLRALRGLCEALQMLFSSKLEK